MGFRLFKRFASLMVVPILLTNLLLVAPGAADAASGGRIGGGSFRSSPSPRSYGSGGGRYRGGSGRTGGSYIPVPYGGGYYGGGYYGGGGFGLPFVVPIFGFGGGLLGFLVLMAVLGLMVNAIRPSAPTSYGGGLPGDDTYGSLEGPVSIAQVQVGLLPSAKQLQDDLRRMAATADTSSTSGLQRVLQESTLSLLRNPELWVYANVESAQVSFNAAESTFNRLSMQERSKLRKELTSNVAGRRSQDSQSGTTSGPSDATSDFIAVTLLVATRRRLALKDAHTAETLREALQQLGAIGDEELLALEVIWQPEGAGEVLTTEELLTAYPQLQHL
ncbi:MAG: DUF1517 domain-containing protein [Cyanobacteriota bacterium]|nr:DUF1517 domain-containing protein [Cyanobacteriota bacterium]